MRNHGDGYYYVGKDMAPAGVTQLGGTLINEDFTHFKQLFISDNQLYLHTGETLATAPIVRVFYI